MIGHLLNTTCEISRPSRASDNQGGWIEAPSIVATTPCRMMSAGAKDLDAARRAEASVTHVVYTPDDADIRIGDTLIIGGVSYRVVIAGTEPSVPIYRKVLVELRQTGEA